jgi:CRP-like cAMP-binding protein
MNLIDCTLFRNTTIDLSAITINIYPSNFTIALEDEKSTYIGIVLEGKLLIKAYSLGGRNFTINTLEPGMIFGDVLLFGKLGNTYPGNLITKGVVTLAVIPNEAIMEYIKDPIFLSNFLQVLSDKVYMVNTKNKLLSQDSIRDKIIYYLTEERRHQHSNVIQLNMSKEELANHLFIPRPSLSRELIHMRDEGLILFDRYTITLKKLM